MTAPDGYRASPAALTEAAAGIEDALTELRSIDSVGEAQVGRGTSHLVLGVAAVGHTGLAEALAGFCTTWEWGVRDLVQAGTRIVDGLNGTATSYQKAERAVEDVLRRVVSDSTADPRADPGTAATRSWEQLLAPQHPDHGGWQQTADRAGATWTDTAHDVWENSAPGMIERALNGENPVQGQLDDLQGLSEIGD